MPGRQIGVDMAEIDDVFRRVEIRARLVNGIRTRTGGKRAVLDRRVLGRDVEGGRTEIDSAQNSAVLGDANAIVNWIMEVRRMPICGRRQI